MDNVVERIVQEVIKRISQPQPLGKRMLTLFCGGTIGSKEGFAEVKKLMDDGYECQVVLTGAGESVLGGTQRFQKELGQVPIHTDFTGAKPGDLLGNADCIVIPVLTLNTAAKIASGICDNLVTNLVTQGLLLGLPIFAATNACDTENPVRAQIGMTKANAAYSRLYAKNLEMLESYGITMVEATQLVAAMSGQKVQKEVYYVDEPKQQAGSSSLVFQKRILSISDLMSCPDGSKVQIARKTLVTAASQDYAREHRIQLEVI